jgi:mono/diheme cytochrome c family protein
MQRRPLFLFAFVAICLMVVGGGNAIRKAVDPSVAGTGSPVLESLGNVIKGLVSTRLGYKTADPNNPKQVTRGAEIYAKHCASCHGANLQGQANWRQRNPDGTMPAPPHDASGHTWHHPDSLLFDYTKKGGQALAPKDFKSAMPSYGGVLADSDIWSVLAYVKSRWPAKIRARQMRLNN